MQRSNNCQIRTILYIKSTYITSVLYLLNSSHSFDQYLIISFSSTSIQNPLILNSLIDIDQIHIIAFRGSQLWPSSPRTGGHVKWNWRLQTQQQSRNKRCPYVCMLPVTRSLSFFVLCSPEQHKRTLYFITLKFKCRYGKFICGKFCFRTFSQSKYIPTLYYVPA